MAEAYIVDAVRTAGGRRGGKLAGWHPADLAGEVLNALVDRSGIDPAAIEDVVLGCVTQAGEQGFAFGRNAVLASRLPEGVPAVTIDRQCGSSQQAIQFAAQAGDKGAAIDAREHDIHQDEVRLPVTRHHQALGAVASNRHGVPLALQHHFDELRDIFLIFDYKDS